MSARLEKPPKLLDRATAISCLVVNQCATPGLGSLIARRFVSGCGQISLAAIGVALVALWVLQNFIKLRRLMENAPVDPGANSWLGIAGLAIFLAAWLWAWVTSFTLLREAKRNQVRCS